MPSRDKKLNSTIVLTLGTFDLFHEGHVKFLKKARGLGDELWVSLNRDEFVAEFKRRPICNYKQRESVLKSCRYVDKVYPNFGGANAKSAIIYADPTIIAIGDDWKEKDYLGQLNITQRWLDMYEIEIVYLPYTKSISTTSIIEKCRKQ